MTMLTIEATWLWPEARPELRTNRRWRLDWAGPGTYIIQSRGGPELDTEAHWGEGPDLREFHLG